MVTSPNPTIDPQADETLADEARLAAEVLRVEAEAINRIQIQPVFHEAVDLIVRSTRFHPSGAARQAPPASDSGSGESEDGGSEGGGAVVVSGLGKSGLIGQKISATLASTGTPSHFLHPTEAMHGDLGRVRRGDVVVLLSFGGNTEEVVSLATILRQDHVPVISIVGKLECDLARLSTVTLSVGEMDEACPLNLAPTASTTAMLALGDALALCVGRRARFGVGDFYKNHPGGMLGRQLRPVVDVMRVRAGENLPVVLDDVTVESALRTADEMGEGRRVGALLVVDHHGQLAGIFTDSDLRRLLVSRGPRTLTDPIRDVMTAQPRHLTDLDLVRDAVQLVREHRIDEVPVVSSDGRPLGLIDVQDLVALKVIEG